MCEFACETVLCTDAYHHCLRHTRCLGVYVNETAAPVNEEEVWWEPRTARATLKTYVVLNKSEIDAGAVILSEADWLKRRMTNGQWARHQARGAEALLPTSLTYDAAADKYGYLSAFWYGGRGPTPPTYFTYAEGGGARKSYYYYGDQTAAATI